VVSLSMVVTLSAREPGALVAAAPFLVLWILAPIIAYRLSVPVGARVRPLSDHERRRLRLAGRRTWPYFETFVTEADGWMPPDNFQEGDEPKLARRTSPTNIGMGLLSTLAAHDLGYLTAEVLADRLDRMLTALESLERYAGHFLNWYDTGRRAPPHPRYISTVDSGNLAGALIALGHGLQTLTSEPQSLGARVAGLADTAHLLAEPSSSSSSGGYERQRLGDINRLARAIVAEARGESGEALPDRLRGAGPPPPAPAQTRKTEEEHTAT